MFNLFCSQCFVTAYLTHTLMPAIETTMSPLDAAKCVNITYEKPGRQDFFQSYQVLSSASDLPNLVDAQYL